MDPSSQLLRGRAVLPLTEATILKKIFDRCQAPRASSSSNGTASAKGPALVAEDRTNSSGEKAMAKATVKSDGELAAVFKSDLTNLRNLVTCSICDQFLYEPWTLSCGHTYCYSCLCNWFVPNKRKKTCPECRTSVKQVPAPAFLVKQMVEIFIKRSELMPSDETIDQHQKKRLEETVAVDEDRSGPDGLFRGTFPAGRKELWLDESDGVLRCPECGHEHEGGPTCQRCGAELDEDGYDFSDLDDEADLDDLDELEVDLDAEMPLPPPWPFHHGHGSVSGSDDEDSEDEEESDDTNGSMHSLDDFVIPDDPEPGHHPPNRASSRTPNVRQPITISDSDSDSDSDEGGAVSNRRTRRTGRSGTYEPSATIPVVTVSEESTNGSDNGNYNHDAALLRDAGWSPLDQGTDSEPDHEDEGYGYEYDGVEGDQDADDESDTETEVGYGMYDGASDHRSRESMSAAPHYDSTPYPPSYTSEEDANGYESEAGLSGITDRDGDTPMSPSLSNRSVSVSTSGYGYDTTGDLGVTNHIHEPNDDSSDTSIRPPPRRIARRYHPNPRVQQYDPRISMIFAEHQQSMRGAQNLQLGLEDWGNSDTRRVEPASRARRLPAYRVQPPRRADPPATRTISSSDRASRHPRQYSRWSHS